jgi:hypothetical protein
MLATSEGSALSTIDSRADVVELAASEAVGSMPNEAVIEARLAALDAVREATVDTESPPPRLLGRSVSTHCARAALGASASVTER